MKKLRFVVPTMVLAVAMMGAGYAAWSDSVTINNSVTTGQFNFQLAAGTQADGIGLTSALVGVTAVNDTVDVNNQTSTLQVTNMYPGASAVIDIPVANASTIPATMTVSVSGVDAALFNVTATPTTEALAPLTGTTIRVTITALDNNIETLVPVQTYTVGSVSAVFNQ